MRTIEIMRGDITGLKVEAIVNAGRSSLLGGGGVDGAIHLAAGPELLAACRSIPEVRPGVRCPVGEARITPGFELPSKWVIHTVGPVWSASPRDAEQLASCYASALTLAAAHAISSIAFPAISTGAYGYPLREAARIAVDELRRGLAAYPSIRRVIACCYDREMERVYRAQLDADRNAGSDER